MGEVFVGHQVVRLDRALDIFTVDPNSYPHDHVLRSLGDLAIKTEQVGALQSLEAEVLVVEVSVVDDGGVQLICMFHDDIVGVVCNHPSRLSRLGIDIVVEVGDDSGELLLGLLVEVGDCYASSEDSVIRMGDGHVCGGLCGLKIGCNQQ